MFYLQFVFAFIFLFTLNAHSIETEDANARMVTVRVRTDEQTLEGIIIKAIPDADKKNVTTFGTTDNKGEVRNILFNESYNLQAHVGNENVPIAYKKVTNHESEIVIDVPTLWLVEVQLFKGPKKAKINYMSVNNMEVYVDKNQPFLFAVGHDLEINAKSDACSTSKRVRIYPRTDEKKRIVTLKCS
jgi:hypothetical protein